MSKYRFHHKILTFLKGKYDMHNMEVASKYCFNSEQIAKELNINVNKSEYILFDLKEFDCVNFSNNWGFKISENGIKKQLTKFFIYKRNENLKSNLKDLVQIIVPVLA